MTQEQEWQKWRRQEFYFLCESIAWANNIFRTTDVGIEGSRHYGLALFEHSIECARGIRQFIHEGVPGPAFALARAQYEAALRGHIIVHEIDLEELNWVLAGIQGWQQNTQSKKRFPKIEISRAKWRCVVADTETEWRPLQCEIAALFVGSVKNSMDMLHDLTHSGMTHALQMLDENRCIGPNYSEKNLTLLLSFADISVMFAIMTWPGTEQKYCRAIEQRVERVSQLRSTWEPYIGNSAA